MTDYHQLFKLDVLGGFTAAAVCVFSILTLFYSWRFIDWQGGRLKYYTYIILTAAAAVCAAIANNFILLLACWGFLGLTLYLLTAMGDEEAYLAAKKTLVIVGGSDALMLLGVGILYYFTQSLRMDAVRLELANPALVAAYLSIAVACFAKAGAMPFHTWIPDCAKSAPLPVVAFLPASLDKLLGIYLLFRLSLDIFVINRAMSLLLMCVGAATIVAAVMMALVQHNLKRLLGYHAVSQVGYMVLGIATGNPLGIAGGLFHMLNNAIYKSCLFFTAGNVEYRAKTSELDQLGGLARFMPVTYICCMIASFSISGIPAFNGFASKWLIYQGLVDRIGNSTSHAELIFTSLCLLAAMFGSALTLASFMKVLHAVFLGQRAQEGEAPLRIKEVPWQMWLPPAALAFACLLFGVFAFQLPLKYFIFPAVAAAVPGGLAQLRGMWFTDVSTVFILISLAAGWFFFRYAKAPPRQFRSDDWFIGGEAVSSIAENPVTGNDFYATVSEMKFLSRIYALARSGAFDIYEQGKKIFATSRALQRLHNGVLPTYLVWMLLGMLGLFFFLIR